MEIANIYPVRNQNFYREENLTMILAHLVEKKLYNPKNFENCKWIIMDNGAYENEQVSSQLERCVALAEASSIRVDEIVIPDVINDTEANIKLFEANIPIMLDWCGKYHFMFVAQATTFEELNSAIEYINQYEGVFNLSVGISKLSPIDRGAPEAIACYKKCKFPIHFLGIKNSFTELSNVSHLIRSCDTSQLLSIANEDFKTPSVWKYVRQGDNVNLETGMCSPHKLLVLRDRLWRERFEHGLL